MKKIINNPVFIVLWILIILLIVFFIVRFLVNYNYFSKFDTENFSPDDLKVLLLGNINEPYLAHYNRGNINFDNGNYEAAKEEYEQALEKNPPKKKECKIRINLAFSMLKMLNMTDIDTEEKRNKLIEELEKVKEVLLEKGCATEDNDGHSKDAQTLKNDIDKFIEELKNNSAKPDKPDKDDDDDNDKDKKDEEKIKEKLEKLKRDSAKEKQELDELFSKHEYFFDGKTW